MPIADTYIQPKISTYLRNCTYATNIIIPAEVSEQMLI